MTDVVAVGELLIDFTPYGDSRHGQPLYERNPGGAPANVAAALSQLGKSTEFVGKVGDDFFGHELREVLQAGGVGTRGLIMSPEAPTTLAFVKLDESGEREFSFYRNPGADVLLHETELSQEIIAGANILHFGSVSMTAEPSRSATLAAVHLAKDKGAIISYDPNLRPALWNTLDEAKYWILEGMRYADVVKLSEEELEFLTGTNDLEQGADLLAEQYSLPLLLVTQGEKGSRFFSAKGTGSEPGFMVSVVDTTGAGDAFFAGVLYGLLSRSLAPENAVKGELHEILRFANAMGALATTGKGAIPAMPTLAEVNELLEKTQTTH